MLTNTKQENKLAEDVKYLTSDEAIQDFYKECQKNHQKFSKYNRESAPNSFQIMLMADTHRIKIQPTYDVTAIVSTIRYRTQGICQMLVSDKELDYQRLVRLFKNVRKELLDELQNINEQILGNNVLDSDIRLCVSADYISVADFNKVVNIVNMLNADSINNIEGEDINTVFDKYIEMTSFVLDDTNASENKIKIALRNLIKHFNRLSLFNYDLLKQHKDKLRVFGQVMKPALLKHPDTLERLLHLLREKDEAWNDVFNDSYNDKESFYTLSTEFLLAMFDKDDLAELQKAALKVNADAKSEDIFDYSDYLDGLRNYIESIDVLFQPKLSEKIKVVSVLDDTVDFSALRYKIGNLTENVDNHSTQLSCELVLDDIDLNKLQALNIFLRIFNDESDFHFKVKISSKLCEQLIQLGRINEGYINQLKQNGLENESIRDFVANSTFIRIINKLLQLDVVTDNRLEYYKNEISEANETFFVK